MPIYMQFTDVKGDVTTKGWERSGATGGVWKTSSFLTSSPTGPIYVSRISFTSGGGGVDAREPLPTRKAAELFERAKLDPRGGTLYVGTDQGVYSDPLVGHTRLIFGDDQGVWSKGGVGGSGALLNVGGGNTWAGAARPSPGSGVLKSIDSGRTWRASGRPSGPGVYKTTDGGQTWVARKVPVVELFVSDRGSFGARTFRLKDVTVAPGPRGSMELRYSSVEF